MIYLKNKITGSLGKYLVPQGDDYIEMTIEEIETFEIIPLKASMIASRRKFLSDSEIFISLDNPPLEIITRRELAQSQIMQISSAINSEQLQQFSVNF